MVWCFWVLTSGMELICFVERENTSLPKCSTSPICHLDGSLANKYIEYIFSFLLCNPCLTANTVLELTLNTVLDFMHIILYYFYTATQYCVCVLFSTSYESLQVSILLWTFSPAIVGWLSGWQFMWNWYKHSCHHFGIFYYTSMEAKNSHACNFFFMLLSPNHKLSILLSQDKKLMFTC